MDDMSKPTDARTARYAEMLATLLRCETISVREQTDTAKFHAFHVLLRTMFPISSRPPNTPTTTAAFLCGTKTVSHLLGT